jgi:ribonuclease PH
MATRIDKRKDEQLRPARISPGYLSNAPESVLIEFGRTAVVCSATIEEKVPPFLKGRGQGWVTAEYGMLPRSGLERIPRENFRGGRSLEISRLIGRSLRMAVDLKLLAERTITVDCDVLQADGGTRTAAITGGWVALALAEKGLLRQKSIARPFIKDQVAAVSVGLSGGSLLLDLCFSEDSSADVDMNVVALKKGGLVEVQGTAERKPYTLDQMDRMVLLALEGIKKLHAEQIRALKR